MSSQRHTGKKASLEPTSIPVTNPLKSRGFGKGIQARNAQLPHSNLLQKRPVGSPNNGLSQQQETRSIEEQLEGAARFGYNAANIPVHAPEPPELPVQRQEGTFGGWNPPLIQRVDPVMNRLNMWREEQLTQAKAGEPKDVSEQEAGEGEQGIERSHSNDQPLSDTTDNPVMGTVQGLIQPKCEVCEAEEKEETSTVQTKLTVGEPGDKYEQEADAIAAKVVQQLHEPETQQTRSDASIQRQSVVPTIEANDHKELKRDVDVGYPQTLQMKQGGVIDSGITHVPGSNHSLVQRDNPEWEALIAQLGTVDNWNAPDMVETNWNTSGLMLGMTLEIPQQPTEIQIALPHEVPAPPPGTTRQDNTLQSPNTPNCPSGNCHYSPRPQIDTSHFEEIWLYLDRQTAWESIQEKISNVATGWNGLVPLITAYNNAQNDPTLQTPEMGIQAFDQGESGNLTALAEQQEVPRTGASGTTLGALFANESSTDLDLNSRDQRAIDRASRSSAVEESVLESQAADADVRTAVSDVQTKVDAVAQALEAVETAEAGLQLAQAENAQENAQTDYDRAVKARDSMKSDVKDLLDLTKGLVSLGGGDTSSLWDLAGLAASRIVDDSYARQISRAKTKLNQSIARVQGARIEVGREALEDAQAGVRTALSDLDMARQAVKAPLIRRRAAYNALAAVAGRRSGGNSQTRNRITGAIGAIPPTEVVVQRISAIENAANSTLSRVNYTPDSGIGYTMAQHSGNQQTLNTFLTHYGFIYAASSQMGEQKRHWEARLQSLRDVVTSLGGLQGEAPQ